MVGVPRGEFFTTDYTDCTDFFIFSREFALFAVNFNSTMRNPKEPKTLASLRLCVYLNLFLESLQSADFVCPQVKANDAAARVAEGLGIAEGLGLFEDPEGDG